MKKIIVLAASKRIAEMVQQADFLVTELELCCRLAATTGHPGLASLEKALIRAKRLREMLPKCGLNHWETILEAICFLLVLIRKVCSIFNCKKSREVSCESGLDHKNVAYGRWFVSECPSRKNWRNEGIFIAG
jgi:hypothetical protein